MGDIYFFDCLNDRVSKISPGIFENLAVGARSPGFDDAGKLLKPRAVCQRNNDRVDSMMAMIRAVFFRRLASCPALTSCQAGLSGNSFQDRFKTPMPAQFGS